MNVYCFVIDPIAAKDTIVAALQKAQLLAGAVIASQRGEEEPAVLWPDGFQGTFSVS